MKEILNKIIGSVHWIVVALGLMNIWFLYEDHSLQIEEVFSRETQIESEIGEKKRNLEEIKDFIKRADEFKARIEQVAKNIETTQRQLPQETNDDKIMTFFKSEMGLLNIKESSVTSNEEQKTTYFISKDFNLKAEGTFLQFLVFFERLKEQDRIYSIKELKIINSNDNQKGRFKMLSFQSVIQAFRYDPDFKVDRGF
jgi:Tfp pilus assembly protein PilO